MFNMARRYNYRIRPNKFKNKADVTDLHHKLDRILRRDAKVLKDMEGKSFAPFAHPNKEYDKFKFVFLDTPEALVEEGKSMRHCVGGYSEQCLDGDSIIFSMRMGGRGYITLELRGTDLQLVQKYTIKDKLVENKDILKLIDRWHSDIINMHKDDEECYADTCERLAEEELDKVIKKNGRTLDDEGNEVGESTDDTKITAEISALQSHINALESTGFAAREAAAAAMTPTTTSTGLLRGIGGGIGE